MAMARVSKNDKVALLASLPLFERCTKRELGHVASVLVQTAKPAGSVLTREGEVGGLAFIILDGVAEVRRGTTSLGKAGPGEMIGELALIDGRRRSASVRATTDLDVLEFASEDFERLLDTVPNFSRNLLRALSARITGDGRSLAGGAVAGSLLRSRAWSTARPSWPA